MTSKTSSSSGNASGQNDRPDASEWRPPNTDIAFYIGLCILGGSYILFILAMLAADGFYALTNTENALTAIFSDDIKYSLKLTLLSCCIATILSLWVAVPIGYLMSRFEFPGKMILDAILDIPIVLPPLVIGLSLLILFQKTPLSVIDNELLIAYHIPAVILAQFSVACAFATRTLRAAFDDIPIRREQVALTLGCTRSQAFWTVVLPEAWRGILTAGTLAWARSLGEFGPILVFAGATRGKTEVLSTSVHLELSIGNLEGAVAISLMMIAIAVLVLVVFRMIAGKAFSMI